MDAEFITDDAETWLREHARSHGFELDAAQCEALPHFRRLQAELLEREREAASLLHWFAPQKNIVGIYLWGGVGRGKSFLMDSFYAAVPLARKQRLHFHRFMQEVHRMLGELQGAADPVRAVAAHIAESARLLCLDEMQVGDIGDAMIMRRLLEGLFEEGVVLVTTSNQQPDDLYRHGLQRSQFEPAIELLKQHLAVVQVDGGRDYRLCTLEQAGVYHIGAEAEQRLHQTFVSIARHDGEVGAELDIAGHTLPARRQAPGVAWFEFDELCGGPHGHRDYTELARRFHTVLLSGLPHFAEEDAEAMCRFIWLVDEFYDRRVKLILSATVPLEILCRDADEEFERTASRLVEMQTTHYLSAAHLA